MKQHEVAFRGNDDNIDIIEVRIGGSDVVGYISAKNLVLALRELEFEIRDTYNHEDY